eukprot:TRINITY_DN24100_c0_g2_i1.p1 TRINITY_DN24100_c0_g2~~TRINITY_DN24100_c0_g2_i1.p1  ORF type:complete len:244 (+),score=46.51 TRINITY_DN24100_c0_g2_i1:67-798(+)
MAHSYVMDSDLWSMERAPSDIMAHSYVLDSNLWSMERATSDSESNASLRSSYYSDVSTDCTLLSDDDDDDDDMFLFDGPQPAQTIFDMDAYFATRPLSDHPASSDEDESDDGLDDDAAAALDRRPLQRAAHEFDASLAAGAVATRAAHRTRDHAAFILASITPCVHGFFHLNLLAAKTGRSSCLRDFMGRKQRLEADESKRSAVLVEQAGGRSSSSAYCLDDAAVIEDLERASQRADEPVRTR